MPPETSRVRLYVISDGITPALVQAPKVLNQEMNAALGVGGGTFLRAFAPQLKGGGIRMKRPGFSRKIGRVSNPAVTRAAGFRGEVKGIRQLQGKLLVVRTSNEAMVAHEKGAVIRPKPGGALTRLLGLQKGGLAIKVRTAEDAAKAGLPWGGKPFSFTRPFVRLKPKLGFYRTWEAKLPDLVARLEKGVGRAVSRVNRKQFGANPAGEAQS